MRKYLNTAEDVIKALRDGKEVKLEDGGEGRISIIDNFVVKNTNNGYHINYTINQRDKPYIEEEDKLKLEVGKCYKTRDGSKAHCFFADKCLSFFRFTIDGLMDVVETNKDGEQIIPGRFDGEMLSTDIVGYWEEFEDFKWWI